MIFCQEERQGSLGYGTLQSSRIKTTTRLSNKNNDVRSISSGVAGRPISDGPNLDGRSGLVYSAGSLDGPRFGRTALDQSSCLDGRSELSVQVYCCSENSWWISESSDVNISV